MSDTQKKIDDLKISNLASGGGFRIDDIPIRKFYDQSQHIYNKILPGIVQREYAKNPKADPTKSADYIFFHDTYKCFLYAVMILDRDRYYIKKMQRMKQMNDFLESRVSIAERELLKYTTLEDVWISEGYELISESVRKRVEDLLKTK